MECQAALDDFRVFMTFIVILLIVLALIFMADIARKEEPTE